MWRERYFAHFKGVNYCNGFCRHIDLRYRREYDMTKSQKKVDKASRELLLTIIGAASDRATPGRKVRQVRHVDHLEGPVFTDAFVTVCCKKMLRITLDIRGTVRETTGLYLSDYNTYQVNPQGLARLTQDEITQGNIWAPTLHEVGHWLKINGPTIHDVAGCLSKSLAIGPAIIDDIHRSEGREAVESLLNVEIDYYYNQAVVRNWRLIDTVVIPCLWRDSWYLVCATKGVQEILTVFCFDKPGEVIAEQEETLKGAGMIALYALNKVNQTQGNHGEVGQRLTPQLVVADVEGVPGGLLTMLVVHDIMGHPNTKPIYTPQICDYLRDPACLRATLDNLQLSLALDREIPRVIALPSVDPQLTGRARSYGERAREPRDHSQGPSRRRELKYQRKGAQ